MPIFETDDKKVEAKSPNLLSFADCPNGCKNGKIFDMYNHREKVCEYCAEKRKKMVYEGLSDVDYGSINKVLNLPPTFRGYTLKADDLFSSISDLDEYSAESVKEAKDEIDTLLKNMAIGVQPEYSVAIQLPHFFNDFDFMATYLIRSYISGFETAPILNPSDIVQIRRDYVNDTHKHRLSDTLSFEKLLNIDTVVIYVDNGVEHTELNAIYGFANLRGTKYKPTILILKKRENMLCKDKFDAIQPDYKVFKVVALEKRKKVANNNSTVGRTNLSKNIPF